MLGVSQHPPASGAGLARWSRDWLLVAAGTLTVAAMPVFALDIGGLASQAILCWILVAAFQVAMVVFAAGVARALDRANPARRFWFGYAFAGFVYALGDVLQVVVAVVQPGTHEAFGGGVMRTACLGVGTAIVLVVILSYPFGLRSKGERWRLWLDLATVMIGAASFGTFWAGSGGFGGRLGVGDLLDVLAGPVPTLVAVFAVAKLLISGRSPFTWQTGMLGGVAAAIEGASRALDTPLVDGGHAGWLFAMTVPAHLLLMASARVQERQIFADPGALRDRRRGPYTPLPYVAIGATYAFLGVSMATTGVNTRTWLLFGCAVACTTFVVGRQLLAFDDNARLLGELDLKVRELNRAEGVLRSALAERDELAVQVQELAFSDSVTGLANRTMFTLRLDEAWARVRGYGGEIGVMLVNLDDFKSVNEQLGHAAGDLLLKQAGARLVAGLREGSLVARLGADEFAVLLEEETTDHLDQVARRIRESLAEPYPIWGEKVQISASLGIALEHGDRAEAEQLLRDADAAMFTAKRRGRGSAEIFA